MGPIAQLGEDFTRSMFVGLAAGGTFGAAIPQRLVVALVIAAFFLSCISIVRATQALGRESSLTSSTDARLDAAADALAKAKAAARDDE